MKILKILGIFLVLILVGVGAFAGYIAYKGIPTYEAKVVEVDVKLTPEIAAEGQRIAAMMCKNCHFNDETGKFTGALLKDVPDMFGKLYSTNITNHPEKGIGSWTDGQLAYFLRTGIKPDGNHAVIMPSLVHFSDDDLSAVISFLRSDHPWVDASDYKTPPSEYTFLTKVLANFVMTPPPFPDKPVVAPDPSDKVAYGRYLVVGKWDCYSCHSADFKTNNLLEPEKSPGFLGGGNLMLDDNGKEIFTANITFDEETGIGTWTEEQFANALRYGQTPHGNPLRYPMIPFAAFTDEEVSAIYAYLQTVPKIENEVNRNR